MKERDSSLQKNTRFRLVQITRSNNTLTKLDKGKLHTDKTRHMHTHYSAGSRQRPTGKDVPPNINSFLNFFVSQKSINQ